MWKHWQKLNTSTSTWYNHPLATSTIPGERQNVASSLEEYLFSFPHSSSTGWILSPKVKFSIPFQRKYGYIRYKRWRAIPTQWRKASDILTSTVAAFLFSNHPKRERNREAHLNYYASAYNRGRQLSHGKTKLNQILQKNMLTKKTCILN